MPVTSFNSVDLPEPLRPTSPKVFPRGTESETSRSAGMIAEGASGRFSRFTQRTSSLLSVVCSRRMVLLRKLLLTPVSTMASEVDIRRAPRTPHGGARTPAPR